jgi:hypothetical protein
VYLRSERRLLVTVNVVPSSPILIALTMAPLRSSDRSVLIRATQRKIPEDGILLCYLVIRRNPYNNCGTYCAIKLRISLIKNIEKVDYTG